jgi:hypothetical protein
MGEGRRCWSHPRPSESSDDVLAIAPDLGQSISHDSMVRMRHIVSGRKPEAVFFHERQISLEQARFYSRQIGRRVLAETALAAAVLFPIGEVLA